MTKVLTTIPPINQPVFDRATMLMTEPWYRFLETLRDRTGGDVDAVEGANVSAAQAGASAAQANDDVADLRTNMVIAGRGLEGGGAIGDGVRIDALQDDGWVASTGTGDKASPFAPYPAVTASATYDQVQVQALMNALRALSLRYVALEAAMFANESLTSA